MSLTCIIKARVFIHFVSQYPNSMWDRQASTTHAMDMIRDERRSNNTEIDRETLSFHIDACLREHEDIYGAFINQLDKDNLPTNLLNSLCDIYEEMCPNNFSRLIAYLTLVYQVADSCEEENRRRSSAKNCRRF